MPKAVSGLQPSRDTLKALGAVEKMTAAEIIYAALVWGEEGMLQMIGGLDDSDPYKSEVSNQWKQLRAYRRRRFGKERNVFEGCKTVTLDELRTERTR